MCNLPGGFKNRDHGTRAALSLSMPAPRSDFASGY
jgi:hypothetical protein